MHAPVFQVDKSRKAGKKFAADAKADLKAVIELLYTRGMWSKFHYEKWMDALNEMTDEVYLHGWWDSVVNSCMYEGDRDGQSSAGSTAANGPTTARPRTCTKNDTRIKDGRISK